MLHRPKAKVIPTQKTPLQPFQRHQAYNSVNQVFYKSELFTLLSIFGKLKSEMSSMENINPIKLTQYSHGAGCGCKISPKILDQILKSNEAFPDDKNLLVGNHSRDDAAVYDLGNGFGLISTTDFFMPIVDDPFDFGRIAAANAISDVYAMGGKTKSGNSYSRMAG